jgi:transcriptional regulator with XRE-family HTH domain
MAGLSQGQVAKLLDVSRPIVSEMEAGNRKISAEELKKLARLYDVTVAWIVGEAPQTFDSKDPRVQLAARELGKLSAKDLDRMLKLLAAVKGESS